MSEQRSRAKSTTYTTKWKLYHFLLREAFCYVRAHSAVAQIPSWATSFLLVHTGLQVKAWNLVMAPWRCSSWAVRPRIPFSSCVVCLRDSVYRVTEPYPSLQSLEPQHNPTFALMYDLRSKYQSQEHMVNISPQDTLQGARRVAPGLLV